MASNVSYCENRGGAVVTALASEFIRQMRVVLAPEEMADVVRLNDLEAPDSNICHSHDFCDANMVMEAAFIRLMGRAPDVMADVDVGLWNAAWDQAVERGFGL